jgi:hypothetical protein
MSCCIWNRPNVGVSNVCLRCERTFALKGSRCIMPVLAFGRVLLKKIEVRVIGVWSLESSGRETLRNCSQVHRAKVCVSHDRRC